MLFASECHTGNPIGGHPDPQMPSLRHYINWTELCRIENGELRSLITLCTDEDVLKGLKRGFPRLFCRRMTGEPFVPWSAIKSAALASAAKEFSEENGYGGHAAGTTEFHNYVAAQNWHYWTNDVFHIPSVELEAIPPDVLAQMIGQKFGWDGVKIRWSDEEYVVASTGGVFTPDQVEFDDGPKTEFDETSLTSAVGRNIVRLVPYDPKDRSGTFRLVPIRFINFNL